MAPSVDGKLLFVSDQKSNALRVIDLSKREAVRSIDLGESPEGVGLRQQHPACKESTERAANERCVFGGHGIPLLDCGFQLRSHEPKERVGTTERIARICRKQGTMLSSVGWGQIPVSLP